MKKRKIFLPIGMLVIVLVAGMGLLTYKMLTPQVNPNDEKPTLVETPPAVNRVNSISLSTRPYVELVPHTRDDNTQCGGVNMNITHLQNEEEQAEYELEYTTAKLIQGVSGTRKFVNDTEKHKPLMFGTCSSGRCVCHDDITGGSLKLSFVGKEEYTVKGDFSVQNVGEKDGMLVSRDVRLKLDVSKALPKTTEVLIMNTFGLPAPLTEKIVLGPYGVFVENPKEVKGKITATLQSKEVGKGKIQFHDGTSWKVLEAKVDGDKATFEIDKLGVIVMTE